MAGGESKCRRGADCCYEHPARPTEPATPAASAKPAAAVPADPHGAPPPYTPAVVPVPAQSALPAAQLLVDFTSMPETGIQETSCRNTTSPECTPSFGCDLAYWGKLINEKAKQGIECCLPKSYDKTHRSAYDKPNRMASMITGQPRPSPPEDTLDMQTSQELHENDGAGDDYDYYYDYDVSMGAAGMVTSIAEVEQVIS